MSLFKKVFQKWSHHLLASESITFISCWICMWCVQQNESSQEAVIKWVCTLNNNNNSQFQQASLTDEGQGWSYISLSFINHLQNGLNLSLSFSFLSSPSQLVSMETGFFFSPVLFLCRLDHFAETRTRNRPAFTNCLDHQRVIWWSDGHGDLQ